VKAEHLELAKAEKAELFNFMKETRNKEENRRVFDAAYDHYKVCI
jgi:hypothetical protein